MLTAAILAGGLATRLGKLTIDIPKSLIEIDGKPFIYWQLILLRKNGIDNIVLCLSHKSDLIVKYVGDGTKFGLNVKYSFDGDFQLGTGGAIRKALPILSEKFMVIYGDSYLDVDYNKIEKEFIKSSMPAMMTVFKNNNMFDKSNVLFQDKLIKEYKKMESESTYNYIDFGLNFFEKNIFEKFEFSKKFDLSEVHKTLVQDGKLAGYEVNNRFYEIGSLKGIEEFGLFIKGVKNEF